MFECSVYTDRDSTKWDEFVNVANNGTIFHLRRFSGYHPKDRFEDNSLLFHKNGNLAAILPACIIQDGSKKSLHSHRGASFGGFVLEESSGLKETFDLVESLKNYAHLNSFNEIILTLPPLIYLTRLSNNLDFALIKHGFSYAKREVSSVLSLKPSLSANLKNFRAEARTAFRRAQKNGVKIKESDDYTTFYKLLESNLWTRHGVTPTHTVDELDKLKNLFPDKIELLAAFAERKMIAGVILIECNPKAIIAFYICHDENYQKFRAVNFLFHDIIKRAIQRKFKYLDFGTFTVDMEPNWGLSRFKESFGASGLFRDTFKFEL